MRRLLLLPFRMVGWMFHAAGWVLVISALVGTGALLVLRSMPGVSFEGPLPALTPAQQVLSERLRQHVVAVASVEHNVVNAYPELERSAQYIEQQLTSLGLTPRRQVYTAMGLPVRNIEVRLPARNNPTGQVMVIGAHYDSGLGSPGANDNGTGVAVLLELARSLALQPAEQRAADLLLVFYVNEEPPFFRKDLMGSRVHARSLVQGKVPALGMLALETLGAYSDVKGSQHYPPLVKHFFPDTGNFVGFVGTTSAYGFVRDSVKAFRESAQFPSQGLAAPSQIPGVDWSDHQAYAEADIPALMVTDTAIYRYAQYHTAGDTADHVDFDRLARVAQGLTGVASTLAAPTGGAGGSH